MVMSMTTSATTVTISGAISTSFPVPTSGTQEVINIAGTGNGAVQTLRTIAAGKRFYLYGYNQGNGPNFQSHVFKTDGTTIVCMTYSGDTTKFGHTITSFCPIWIYEATESIKVNVTNGCTYNLWGIEI